MKLQTAESHNAGTVKKEGLRLHMVHIGKKIPKKFIEMGWRETCAHHLGKGIWAISAERELKPEEQ